MTLTREEILHKQPGQELSEWVAVHVMGWTKETFDSGTVRWYESKDGVYTHSPKGGDWNPSEDISAAWEVEERISVLEKEGHYVKALCDVVGTPRDGTRILAMDDWRMLHARPEQRCKAALLAVLNL